jgi:hypothetical protein
VVKMPFGKYKGRRLADLPDDYLDWLLTIDLRPFLRSAVAKEVARRVIDDQYRLPAFPPCPAPDVAADLVGAGLRSLSRRYHPDIGGTHDQMIRVTAVADWFRTLLRELKT